jgi:hypothetical protein
MFAIFLSYSAAFATTYTYDSLGRLKSATSPKRTVEYTYDAAGNILSVNVIKNTPDDTTTPNTAITLNPLTPNGDNNFYITAPTITLTPDETATTYYRFDSNQDHTHIYNKHVPYIP